MATGGRRFDSVKLGAMVPYADASGAGSTTATCAYLLSAVRDDDGVEPFLECDGARHASDLDAESP